MNADIVLTARQARAAADGQLALARVLVVDDSGSDQRLITEMLVEAGATREHLQRASTLAEARRSLSEHPATCILLDLSLPDATGLEGVAVLSAAVPDTPIVVITGHPADWLVYAAMAEGADEYLCKAELEPERLRDVLLRSIQRRHGAGRHDHRPGEAALVLDSIDAPTVALDGTGRIIAVNGAWTAVSVRSGTSREATEIGVNYLAVCDRASGPLAEGAREAAGGIRAVLHGETDRFAMDYLCPQDGRDRWFSLRVTPLGPLGGGAVVTHMDITELKLAERRLQRQEATLHAVLAESSPIFALLDADGALQHVSDATVRLFALAPDETSGTRAFERLTDHDRGTLRATFLRVVEVPGASERLHLQAVDGEGRRRELDLVVTNLLHEPSVAAVTVTGSDVTDGRLHQIVRHLEARLLQNLPTAVGVVDDNGVVVYWNTRAEVLYGRAAADVVGRPIAELDLGPTDEAVEREVGRALAGNGRWEGDYDVRRPDGGVVAVHATIDHIEDGEIDFRGMVSASIDIGERRRLEEDLAFQALHDPLTGLPNRRLFVDHVEKALARDGRTGTRTAVMFIDLDEFKQVNDRTGHVSGDEVLRTAGQRLGGAVRHGDVVARFGGDEFVVCCEGLADAAEATTVADRLLGVLRAPLSVHRQSLELSASVGIALSGSHPEAEELLRRADVAMYAAKEGGKGRVEVFDDTLRIRSRRRRHLASALTAALEAGDVRAHFQPQVALGSRELVGFEALARWTDPERGVVPPDEFVPVAEDSGLIVDLGRAMLTQTCSALASWTTATPGRPLKAAVNVSTRQLSDPCFPHLVQATLTRFALPAHQLCLEITESALAETEQVRAALHQLKEIGVEIAIDDFGTGYSSLGRLQQFPVDYLKVDRTFVAGMMERHHDAVIVSAVLALARALGLHTVAEGVETAAQHAELLAYGCDLGQGYLWSPAVTAERALELVRGPEPFSG